MSQLLHEAQKALDLKVVMRLLPLSYLCHLVTVGVEPFLIYDMAETLHAFREWLALL